MSSEQQCELCNNPLNNGKTVVLRGMGAQSINKASSARESDIEEFIQSAKKYGNKKQFESDRKKAKPPGADYHQVCSMNLGTIKEMPKQIPKTQWSSRRKGR